MNNNIRKGRPSGQWLKGGQYVATWPKEALLRLWPSIPSLCYLWTPSSIYNLDSPPHNSGHTFIMTTSYEPCVRLARRPAIRLRAGLINEPICPSSSSKPVGFCSRRRARYARTLERTHDDARRYIICDESCIDGVRYITTAPDNFIKTFRGLKKC